MKSDQFYEYAAVKLPIPLYIEHLFNIYENLISIENSIDNIMINNIK